MINNIKYDEVDSLECLAEEVDSKAKEYGPLNNLIVTCSISAINLRTKQLIDVTDSAKKWIAEDCPADLYINHGQYVKDGMNHIINELKNKPSSNRALYSLISQNDISSSGDKPIPSFLIFQTKLAGNELFATVYFRALETHNFFPINLEEIRLRLVEILDKLTQIKSVNLFVYAFFAYRNPSIVPLVKPEIDLLKSPALNKLLNSDPRKLRELLEAKSNNSTVVELTAIHFIRDIFLEDPPEKLHSDKELILLLLEDCIKKGEILKIRRETTSHCYDLDEVSDNFSSSLRELAKGLSRNT